MARFKFYLIGSSDAPVLDVEADDLTALNESMSRNRFIEGRMSNPDDEGVCAGVLIAISRIQLIVES